MSDPINVLIALPTPLADRLAEQVRAVSPRLRVETCLADSLEDMGGVLSSAEVLLTSLGLPAADQAPNLRWVQAYVAGVDRWMATASDRLNDVVLTTASGVHGPVMAEYAIMMMLAWAHLLPKLSADQSRREWPAERRDALMPAELKGATLGIVGYGSVGREAARLARALGMRVLACKRDPSQKADAGWVLPDTGDPAGVLPERYYAIEQLHEMLGQSDYVLLTLALTPASRHIIDAAALRCMKRSAELVNVARGGLVDEPALVEALRSGTIRAVGLDVFEIEPLPADSPLWSMPNVLLTPHMSGITPAYDERLIALFTENLRRYLDKEPLLNRVDPAAGY
jgi:phosphoglycerate dehydrogenase-like enzyme